MSYSLSQLDAIGDVDPVAEADVYLAYGRDLQAEEILKEAMRADPDRLAIRTKLLEVYAKRRDTKGFEQLAIQLYGMTKGEGDEWSHAQQLGWEIDPENTLYQPGGKPLAQQIGDKMVMEPLGASTMPQSVMPTNLEPHHTEPDIGADLGLDLDLDLDGAAHLPRHEATQPVQAIAPAELDNSMDFDLGEPAPAAAFKPSVAPQEPDPFDKLEAFDSLPSSAPKAPAQPLDFGLGDLSLDLPENPKPTTAAASDDFAISGFGDDDESADPLARKLELAEEFRQIGDIEGARDVLQEVIARSSGALKSKAEGMLADLE